MHQRRAMGTLEAAVLARLWAHPEGATPATILEELDGELAYTTVMTVLTRLWDKGLAARVRRGRGYVYQAELTEAELLASRMAAALDRATDRGATLTAFLGSLSKKDERTLRRLLQPRPTGR